MALFTNYEDSTSKSPENFNRYYTYEAKFPEVNKFLVSCGSEKLDVTRPEGIEPGSSFIISPVAPQHNLTYQYVHYIIPTNAEPGKKMKVFLQKNEFEIVCPDNASPGMQVRIRIPIDEETKQSNEEKKTQKFQAVIPAGVQPGQSFVVKAGKNRVLINCPKGASPGQIVQFELLRPSPPLLMEGYGQNGWARCINSDFQIQWINTKQFTNRSDALRNQAIGFVRSIKELNIIKFISANELRVSTTIPSISSIHFSSLVYAAKLPFEEKVEWFYQKLSELRIKHNEGNYLIQINRSDILNSSENQFSKIQKEGIHKHFHFRFDDEVADDIGGVSREWFYLVSKELLDPKFNLFQPCVHDQKRVQINPRSMPNMAKYYYFVGRFLGRALFDRQIVSIRFLTPFYKYLLGCPITLSDLEHLGKEYYENILKLFSQDIPSLCLTFSIADDTSEHRTIDLIRNGSDIDVNNENLVDYILKLMKYRLFKQFKLQLKELTRGFYEVVPEQLLTIFSCEEFDFLLCGNYCINIDDWKRNTEYFGIYREQQTHETIRWFWEIVENDLNESQREKLLQYTTGTSSAPGQGFANLHGYDGCIRLFSIQSLSVDYEFPISHTCFNRIDIPVYNSRELLKERLLYVIEHETTGFYNIH